MPNQLVIVKYLVTSFLENRNCIFSAPTFEDPFGTGAASRASIKNPNGNGNGNGNPANDALGVSLKSMKGQGAGGTKQPLDIIFGVGALSPNPEGVGNHYEYIIEMVGFSQTNGTGDDQGTTDFTNLVFNVDGSASVTDNFTQAGVRGQAPAWTFVLAIKRRSDNLRALIDPGIENTNDN